MKFKKEQTGENRISIRNEQIAGRTDPGYKRKKKYFLSGQLENRLHNISPFLQYRIILYSLY